MKFQLEVSNKTTHFLKISALKICQRKPWRVATKDVAGRSTKWPENVSNSWDAQQVEIILQENSIAKISVDIIVWELHHQYIPKTKNCVLSRLQKPRSTVSTLQNDGFTAWELVYAKSLWGAKRQEITFHEKYSANRNVSRNGHIPVLTKKFILKIKLPFGRWQLYLPTNLWYSYKSHD